MSEAIDYDLHGFVGIRLLDAGAAEERLVTRQLGPIRAALAREPDVTIRFVDRLELGPLRLIGADDAAFCDEGFVLLRGKQKSRARVLLPLDRAGDRCEIVAERGLAAVPHLVAIVNLTALAHGVLPLHASAFTWNGAGVLATGWAKGGKTEALLAFLGEGAAYVGDEWIYLGGAGPRMHGIPEPIRVWDWQLREAAWLRERLAAGPRTRLAALRGLARPLAALAGGRHAAARFARRVRPLVEAQRWVQLAPRECFGAERCVASALPDVLFLMASHDAPEIAVRPIEPREVARRMVASLAFERADLVASYQKLRFAFPEARNRWLEGAEARERELLASALGTLPAFEVRHPYPVSFAALHEAMRPHCGAALPRRSSTSSRPQRALGAE